MNSRFRVTYLRDGLTEEFHTGIIQFGCDGEYLTPYYLRSCAKPLQASLLTDYGLDFTPEEIAFCSGSHAGEDCHVEIANRLLKKIGLDESYLKCGVHTPLSRSMQDKMLLNGVKPTPVHNNCSGKHIGFLAVCKKNNWDLKSYYEPNHPLQKKVKEKIYDLCEITENFPMTTDGCGVPIVSMPLKNLVIGYLNLNKRYPEIVKAILANPYIYGGEDRLDTEIIQNSSGIMAKVGAGGLCTVLNTKINECFVIKSDDASNPARKAAVLEYLKKLNWANINYDKTIKTISGKIVGEIIFENLT